MYHCEHHIGPHATEMEEERKGEKELLSVLLSPTLVLIVDIKESLIMVVEECQCLCDCLQRYDNLFYNVISMCSISRISATCVTSMHSYYSY